MLFFCFCFFGGWDEIKKKLSKLQTSVNNKLITSLTVRCFPHFLNFRYLHQERMQLFQGSVNRVPVLHTISSASGRLIFAYIEYVFLNQCRCLTWKQWIKPDTGEL